MTAYVEDSQPGPLTRPALDALLAEIGRLAAVDVSHAKLIKFTNNAVFRLAREPVVVRIAGSKTMRRRVPKVVRVARWLAEQEVAAVRLLPDVPQPLEVQGHLVTLWQAVPDAGPKPTGKDLGAILRQFHRLHNPPFELPSWRPTEEIRQRLAEPEGLADADLAFLLDSCDRVEDTLRRLEFCLPVGPIHGDAFLGNLIPGPDGPVICDFDSTSVGPREWDLTPVAVGRLRFDYSGDAHRELAESYGFDVMDWPGFRVFRQVRELKLVTSVVPILRSNPNIREQWAHRLDTFKRHDETAKWTPYR